MIQEYALFSVTGSIRNWKGFVYENLVHCELRCLLAHRGMVKRSAFFGALPQLFILVFSFHLSAVQVFCSVNPEGLALLQFRSRVTSDPHGILSTWSSNDDTPCMWTGVYCHGGKVQKLDLRECSLNGTLAPEVGKLKDLQALVLYANSFSGVIPKEIGELAKLELLDLRYNNFIGQVPAEIGNIISLKLILLCANNFEGGLIANSVLPEVLKHDIHPQTHCMSNRKLGTRYVKISSGEDENVKHRYFQGQYATLYPRNLLGRRKLLAANLQAPSSVGAPFASSNSLPSGRVNARSRRPRPSNPPAAHPSQPSPIPPSAAPSSTPPPSKPSSKRKPWIYAVAVAGATGVLLIGVVLFFICQRRGVATIKPWKTGLSGQLKTAFVTGAPKLNRPELEAACEDFSNIIGSSPHCTTYKGTLSSGVEIAVTSTTVASSKDWSKCSELYFRKKIDMLSRLNHKNFVNLLGYCIEDEPFTRMMVFEYATNGTLSEHLHVKESEHLDWSARMRIVMGMAYCLQYMHHDLNPPIAHPNLNSSSVYLMDDFAAKLADFTYWKRPDENQKPSDDDAHISLIDQIYSNLESNIFNFGVLLLEIISGKVPHSEEQGFLVNWAVDYLNDKRSISYMIDPSLQSFKKDELDIICEVIQQCIHPDPNQRPTMKEVTAKLRETLQISPEAVIPRLSPLWWAELEILSVEA